jgi:hypothetical protein
MVNEEGYKKRYKKDHIEYTLNWSKYVLADKFRVLTKFNEMTGLYVVFMLNKYRRLEPILLGAAWYSGLRSMILKLYNPSVEETIPGNILSLIGKEKVYIKSMEIYVLDDFLDIFFKLTENYKNVYFDTNGLEKPQNFDPRSIKLVDKETKTYHKSV